MPGCACAISSCKNSINTDSESTFTNKNIIYHKFPKEIELRDAWIARCDRDYTLNTRHARVCSIHFTAEDYEKEINSEILSIPIRRRLKKTAIPSINLGPKWSSPTVHVNRQQVYIVSNTEEYVSCDGQENIDTDCNTDDISGQYEMIQANSLIVKAEPVANTIEVVPLSDFELLMSELESEKRINTALRSQLEKLEEDLTHKSSTVISMRKELNVLRDKLKNQNDTHEKLLVALRSMFTENQIKVLTCKLKRVNWSDEDMVAALTLRFLGKRTYVYLRERLNYPLPSFSTLDRWAALPRVKNKVDAAKHATAQIEEQLADSKKVITKTIKKRIRKEKKQKIEVIPEPQILKHEDYEEMYLVETGNGGNILIPICTLQTGQELFMETTDTITT